MKFEIEISAHALSEMLSLVKTEGDKIRLYVHFSNIYGFKYAITIDSKMNEDDLLLEKWVNSTKLEILIDSISLQYFNGAAVSINERDGIFLIHNPNLGSKR